MREFFNPEDMIRMQAEKGGAGAGAVGGKEHKQTPQDIKKEVESLLDDLEADLELEGFEKGSLDKTQESYLKKSIANSIRDVFREINRKSKNDPEFASLKTEVLEIKNEFINDWMEEASGTEVEKSWEEMNVYELADYLSSVIYGSDDINNAKNRFARLVGEIEDPLERKNLEARVLVQELIIEGDSGQRDFSVWFNSIIERYLTKGMSFQDVTRAFFLKGSERGASFENLEINTEMIDLWDYILKRIKGRYANDVPSDAENSFDKDDPIDEFSYNKLKGDNIDVFIAHLKEKFPSIPENKIEDFIKFAQSHDIKTSGYIPWLAKETTRSHGTAVGKIKGEKLQDALFTAAPFAAGIYSRGRYGNIIANTTSPELIFFKEGLYESLVPTTALKHAEKVRSATSLWSITNEYHKKVLWNGKVPKWVEDMRRMVDKKNCDLPIYESWFPLPGDNIINQVKIEKKKREFLNSENFDSPNERSSRYAFLKEISSLFSRPVKSIDSYVTLDDWKKAFRGFGFGTYDATNEPGTYSTAFDAYSEILGFFQKPLGKLETEGAALDVFETWRNKYIGKAKLIPGRHHLTFVPFTLRAIDKIIDSYIGASNSFKVDNLKKKMIAELGGADGLPTTVQIEVEQRLLADSSYLGLYENPVDRRTYKEHLYDYINKDTKDTFEYNVRKIAPFGIAKKDVNGKNLKAVKPWSWKAKVDKDTSDGK